MQELLHVKNERLATSVESTKEILLTVNEFEPILA